MALTTCLGGHGYRFGSNVIELSWTGEPSTSTLSAKSSAKLWRMNILQQKKPGELGGCGQSQQGDGPEGQAFPALRP